MGTLYYTFERKRIKNLNVRIRSDGSVYVSAPLYMPDKAIESFLQSKASWVFSKQNALQASSVDTPCLYTKEQCLHLFNEVSNRIYPLFMQRIKQKPTLFVRDMKSRWGSCHPYKNKITLSTRLAEKPNALIEYVVLHEYVHLLHPNHGPDFHAEMARLMPDYRIRRKELRG